jgi:hypothetical protein
MAANQAPRDRRYFTVAQANATLPLVRAIIRDITELAAEVRDRHVRLHRIAGPEKTGITAAHREELVNIQEQIERDQERMQEYVHELNKLGVELKDPLVGLIDFPCWMDDHEVYLCWRQGEPEVAHWHEVDAGFAGRQKLMVNAG